MAIFINHTRPFYAGIPEGRAGEAGGQAGGDLAAVRAGGWQAAQAGRIAGSYKPMGAS